MMSSAASITFATATLTCGVPCGTSTVTPNFALIAPFALEILHLYWGIHHKWDYWNFDYSNG
jgi:hypothetical protein